MKAWIMKANLNFIRYQLEEFESNPERALIAMHDNNKKCAVVLAAITNSAIYLNGIDVNDHDGLTTRIVEIITYLDDNYHEYAWPLHDVHFHTNFKAYVHCPFTCITEISVMLDKLVRTRFAA
jgi:hypothetical protein